MPRCWGCSGVQAGPQSFEGTTAEPAGQPSACRVGMRQFERCPHAGIVVASFDWLGGRVRWTSTKNRTTFDIAAVSHLLSSCKPPCNRGRGRALASPGSMRGVISARRCGPDRAANFSILPCSGNSLVSKTAVCRARGVDHSVTSLLRMVVACLSQSATL
jgi:hypothetical protein